MTIYTLHDEYVGCIAEAGGYNVPAAVSRFFEFSSESITGKYSRIESAGIRAGTRVERTDRWAVNPKGADGDLKFEVLDSGFGLLFQHALGTFSAGTPTGGFTPYTFTMGNLQGLSTTWQVGRVDTSGALNPFTYTGGKVKTWEISNALDGVLNMDLSMDFAAENQGAGTGPLAVSTPTYPVGSQLLTFIGGTCTIAGTQFAISSASVKCDNKLDVSRYFINGTNIKKEPIENEYRALTWSLKGEFDSMTQVKRVGSATSAGAMAAIVLTWVSPQGGGLSVTLPNARFDTGPVQAALKTPELTLSGKALDDGTSGPISVVYTTKDLAP
jgi:hypothetical protein